MSKIKVVVTVKDSRDLPLSAVVEDLKEAGMDVGSVLDSINVVTGSVEANHLPALTKVKGVSTAREERQIKLVAPPPR